MSHELKLYPFKCFEQNNQKFIFTSKYNRLIRVDDYLFNVLKKSEKEKFKLFVTEKIKNELIENSLVDLGDGIIYYDDGVVGNLVLMIAQNCNLSCKYCYGGEGEYRNSGKMNINVAKAAVDFLIKNCGNRKQVFIIFFGGEPLLNTELLFELVEYIENIEKNNNIHIGKSMTTNGTLLTEEISNYCMKKDIQVKISIDGPKNINDRVRVYKNGEGTYEDIMKNTQNMRQKQLLSARATITPLFLNQEYVEESLRKNGFASVGSDLARELFEDEDYFRVYKIFSDSFSEIKTMIKENRYEEIKSKSYKAMLYLEHIHKSNISHFHCGTGRNMYAVDINGDVYPCQRFVGKDEYKLGSIYDIEINRKNFLDKIDIDGKNKSQCATCWIKNLCVGSCPYNCYVVTGDVSINSEIICSLNKALYEDAVKMYLTLDEETRKILFRNE